MWVMVPFKPKLRTGLKALIPDINTKCTLENGMGLADILSVTQNIRRTFCQGFLAVILSGRQIIEAYFWDILWGYFFNGFGFNIQIFKWFVVGLVFQKPEWAKIWIKESYWKVIQAVGKFLLLSPPRLAWMTKHPFPCFSVNWTLNLFKRSSCDHFSNSQGKPARLGFQDWMIKWIIS